MVKVKLMNISKGYLHKSSDEALKGRYKSSNVQMCQDAIQRNWMQIEEKSYAFLLLLYLIKGKRANKRYAGITKIENIYKYNFSGFQIQTWMAILKLYVT